MDAKLSRTLSISATIITMIFGILVIIGWLIHNDFLRSIVPGAVKMKFNVALCFVFSSIVLLLYHFGKKSKVQNLVTVFLSVIISLTGLLTLSEYIFSVNLGIDELFARDELRTTATYYAGRMSPISALNFLLIGIGLLLLNREKAVVYQFLYLFEVAFVALLMLISFNFVTDIPTFFRLAIHVAIGFIALPVAIYFAQPILQRRVNFEYLMLTGFIALILLTLVISVYSFYYNAELVSSSRLVEHTHSVIRETDRTLSLTKDIENGTRGYVMLNDSIYLEHAVSAEKTIFSHIKASKELTKDNRSQRVRIDSLSAMINKQIDFSRQLVLSRNEKGFEAAHRMIMTLRGKMYTDEIRKLTAEIQLEENSLLMQRQKKNNESIVAFDYAFRALLISLFILLVTIFFVIRYNLIKRKKAEDQSREREEQLRETNALFSSLFENNPASMVITRCNDGKIIRVNEAFLSYFGFSDRKEVLGKTTRELNIVAQPEQRDDLAKLLQEIKILKDFEIKTLTKQGKVFWVSTSILLIEVEETACLFSISIDITNRKNSETLIQKQKEDIQAFIDSMSTLCAKVSPDGKLLLANKTSMLATGLSMEELLSTNFLEGIWWTFDSEVHSRVSEAFKKACAGIPSNYDENIFVFKQVLTINFSLIPIFGPDGRVEYIVAEGRDITPLKATETALLKQTNQLELVNKELEAFSYSVSHDLRAPLRAIHGYTKMLSEDYVDKLDDEAKKMMNTVLRNAGKMGRLIDDLLAFSKLGKKNLQIAAVDMTQLATTALKDIRYSFPSIKANIVIHPLVPANGDAGLMSQVFANLISNAIKYSEVKDSPAIEIGSREEDGETIYYVKDNGVGFDMKYYDKLFGVFQRLHRDEEFEGTGVGLALVRRIITRHGGKVWAEAELMKGATFYFSLNNKND